MMFPSGQFNATFTRKRLNPNPVKNKLGEKKDDWDTIPVLHFDGLLDELSEAIAYSAPGGTVNSKQRLFTAYEQAVPNPSGVGVIMVVTDIINGDLIIDSTNREYRVVSAIDPGGYHDHFEIMLTEQTGGI